MEKKFAFSATAAAIVVVGAFVVLSGGAFAGLLLCGA